MILIISKEENELSTHDVMNWIEYLGGNCIRLNGEDFNVLGNLNMDLTNDSNEFNLETPNLSLKTLEEINVVWYRRWSDFVFARTIREFPGLPTDFRLKISSALIGESNAIASHLFGLLKNKEWLTPPGSNAVNKLVVLQKARAHGLKIPATLVTSRKKSLIDFYYKYNGLITKAVGDFPFIYLEKGNTISFGTMALEIDEIESFPDAFFPSLFQELIQKDIEIRIFFLENKMYPMAIFSQLDPQTSIDFRNYNFEKPNRTTPYKLPDKIERQLMGFMQSLNLSTGSIDLIKDKNGEMVFLEVNPVGQFGMVSYPCNYKIEKKIAQYLIRRDIKN